MYILVIVRNHVSQSELAKFAEIGLACTCFNLRKASRAVTQFFDEVLQPSGLRVTQFTLLTAISLSDAVTISNLAEGLVMDRTTLTRNLRPLERQGFIKIGPGEDRRTREVRLTARGRNALARAIPLWEQAQTRMVEGLGRNRWRHLLANLAATVELTHPS